MLSDKEGTVIFHGLNRVIAVGLLLGGWAATSAPLAWGQEIKGEETKGQETNRKVKTKVSPVYPELAKRMNITGVVKVRLTIAANGAVKDAQTPGVGKCSSGCGQKVALRDASGRDSRDRGIPF